MARRIEFQIGEWYHCFTRGVEGRTTFQDHTDYDRFLSLVYLANSDLPVTLFSQREHSFADVLCSERKRKVVTVGAYCLMPNHYHLILKEDTEKGISRFMQKLGTGYTMYFNVRNERLGNLFVKPFRAKRLENDNYFQHAIHYVHLNPADLFEPKWKEGHVRNMRSLEKKLTEYPFSSLKDYGDKGRTTSKLLGADVFDVYQDVPFVTILKDAKMYYQQFSA